MKLYTKFKLQKSYSLYLVFLFIHMGAIFCICFMPFAFWVKVIFVIFVLMHLIIVIRNHVLKNSFGAITEFWQDNDGDWCIKKTSGSVEQVQLDFPVFVSNCLIVLNFICTKAFFKKTVLITKDSLLVEDDLRKLKVLLKTIKVMNR